MKKITKQIIFWLPRVLCILFILFITLFSLDVFSEGNGFWKTVLAFLIHNIPTFILIVFLLITWRWDWIGTIFFNAIAVLYVIWAWGKFPVMTYLAIAGPLVFISFLFMLSWVFKKVDGSGEKQEGKNKRVLLLYLTILGTFLMLAAFLIAWNANSEARGIPEHTSILKPQDGEQVQRQIPTMGTFTKADSLKDLWMFVQPADTSLYHPQPGPLQKPPMRMRWYSTAFFGELNDAPGKQYIVYLFSASAEASAEIWDYIAESNKTGLWPGMPALPAGLIPLDTVAVVRK